MTYVRLEIAVGLSVRARRSFPTHVHSPMYTLRPCERARSPPRTLQIKAPPSRLLHTLGVPFGVLQARR